MCSDAPDTSGMNKAAVDSAALSKEALDFYKQQYAEDAPNRKATQDRANQVSDALTSSMTKADARADELDAYNKATYRPLEKQLVEDATAFDTPMRRIAAAQSAMAGVDSSAAEINAARNRELGRAGVAPGSTKAMALAEDAAVAQSKVRAAAGTAAVNNVESQGVARRMDAASLGRNIASAQATQQQIATQAGGGAVGSSMSGLQAGQSGTAAMGQGFSTALNGVGQAGNLYSGIAKIQQTDTGGLMSGIGALAGGAAQLYGAYKSDENIKSDTGTPADTAKALQEIVDTPVEDGWRYDPSKGGPDDGGQRHIGPMAQQVRRISGEQAAPGGKVVSVVDELGRMRAAIQELDKRTASKPPHKSETRMGRAMA